MSLAQSTRTIGYTRTSTHFPNTVSRTLVLEFTGHRIISTIPNTTNHFLFSPLLPSYNYSILSTNSIIQPNVTTCSIAACKPIGHVSTENKVYRVLFDSGLSKILIHKCIVPWTQHLFPLQMIYRSSYLWALQHPWHLWL